MPQNIDEPLNRHSHKTTKSRSFGALLLDCTLANLEILQCDLYSKGHKMQIILCLFSAWHINHIPLSLVI